MVSSGGDISPTHIVPPLKWAGGKRWFVARHLDLVPDKFNRYIEPFVGSAAMFFALAPSRALLSDLNPELINVYRVIRDSPVELMELLAQHARKHSTEYYYRIRSMRTRTPLTGAARLIYLNRTCWNGLYRVNRAGRFNVPIGTKSSVLLESDDFIRLSGLLKDVDLRVSDFEDALNELGEGDFAFVDPPYTVAHNNNGFIKYNQTLFSWEDQIRLRRAVGSAVARGAYVLVTNAAHDSIYDLYEPFERLSVSRAGVIAGDRSARGTFNEMVIRCFPV